MAFERVGKYEVVAALVEGGMSQLFLGATAGPGGFRKYVVIKRVTPSAVDTEYSEHMFLDEARITAAFSHPAIAQVYDLGEDEHGLYVVMEFIAGQNLNQVVYACAKQRAVLPVGYSVSVLHECALALHYAHTFKAPTGESSPVIHRDVAQKNIMVTYDGQVKLLDFGIAKVKNALAKTKAGTVKGTAGYMSPEQVRGEPLDARSDVFSLGIVLWEMVTGRRLFSAETEIEEMRLILDGAVKSPSDLEPSVSPKLSAVVLRALASERERRFGSARQFARALQETCGDLMYDSDARAEFMQARFGANIESTRALFSGAASTSPAEVDRAISSYQSQVRAKDEPRPSVRPPPRVRVSADKLTSGPAKPRGVTKPRHQQETLSEPADEGRAGTLELEAPASLPSPASKKSSGALIILGLLVSAAALFWFLPPSAPPPPVSLLTGLEAIPGAPPTPERPVAPKPSKAEVSLTLIPEATVLLGTQRLASGALVNLTLPVGTHQLTVIGNDGMRHVLSLPVVAGKNAPLKFYVDQLPLK
jgi:serine/threonine protein kinase